MKTIGILGGMGPAATAYFYQLLLSETEAQTDQEHVPTLIYANTSVPDRTKAILSGETEAVGVVLAESAQALAKGGADFIAMPCNTAHYWADTIRTAVDIPLIHMIESTAAHVHRIRGKGPVGLLATSGTVATGIYQQAFEPFGIEIIVPEPDSQDQVMDVIHAVKRGDTSAPTAVKLQDLVNTFQARDIHPTILGCTELPLLIDGRSDAGVINPMVVLARESILCAGGRLKVKNTQHVL